MELLHPHCAALDVSKREAKVCVRVAGAGRDRALSTVTNRCGDQPGTGVAGAADRRAGHVGGDGGHRGLLEAVLLPAGRRPPSRSCWSTPGT